MKWVCLMANMTLPGVGTLICKRWVSGAIQTVGSIIGFTLLGYCIYEFYHALQNYSTSMDGEEEDILAALKHLSNGMMEPLVTGAVGGARRNGECGEGRTRQAEVVVTPTAPLGFALPSHWGSTGSLRWRRPRGMCGR